MCEEFSQCYNDVNICLWTDGSTRSQSAAQSACQQRNSSLPRVTNSDIQNKLGMFRSATGNLLEGSSFWIDVKTDYNHKWHWIDGSLLGGKFVHCLLDEHDSTTLLGNSVLSVHSITRKLTYRNDDRAMRPIYGRPENFQESLTTYTATFPD